MMADQQDPFVIYTTENFEMTALLKELEEKKVEIIYLRELLETKDEEIKVLKADNAKLKTLDQESVKRKRDFMNESSPQAPSTQKTKARKTEDGKEILRSSPTSSKETKLHLYHDGKSTSCSDVSAHTSQYSKIRQIKSITQIENSKPFPHTSPFKVTRNTLIHVHERYQRVLEVVKKEGCSNRQAYKIAGIPRSTVRDMIGIAELHIVDKQEYEMIVKDMKRASSVKNIERACRRKLGEFKKKMSALRSEGKLLPIVFNDEFYNIIVPETKSNVNR
ncbi:uncharacterized protein LOC110252575 [Exaiptasia diaphana]|uniref:Uncharacterized protein n=1 Tax=Exaiptasia diaphana TaxID=2652724 RepID=A0A913Y5J7_EXADI|nr:uncharacterized protein LOC110252575 [Exaiptasia diaphana]